ncbi:MAG: hypothetical protein RR735_08340, partial [Bacteroidales bacterium]
ELNQVKGGQTYTTNHCGCGCAYADNGGSSTDNNGRANSHSNLDSGTSNDKEYVSIIVTP